MFPSHPFRSARRLLIDLALLFSVLLVPSVRAGEITVFAAASLKSALDDVVAPFEVETGHTVVRSHAGSSALARQIELGAPADIFISANPNWMEYLELRGHIAPETRNNLLSNRLVMVAHGTDASPIVLSSDFDLAGYIGNSHLAIALVNAVPAGIYGKAALTHLGLWDEVAPKLAQTDNVRFALALVSLGEAQLGIVYATDALADPSVTTVATFPTNSHPPILYPAAAVAGRAVPDTLQFLAFLRGPEARDIFKQHGFAMVGE